MEGSEQYVLVFWNVDDYVAFMPTDISNSTHVPNQLHKNEN